MSNTGFEVAKASKRNYYGLVLLYTKLYARLLSYFIRNDVFMSEKILIIDDDLDTLRLVGLMLQRQGYQISAATNGQQ